MNDMMIETADGIFYVVDSSQWRKVDINKEHDEKWNNLPAIIDKNDNLWVRENP